jgi:hypothetical protein
MGGSSLAEKRSVSLGSDASELRVIPLTGDQKPFPYLTKPFVEDEPALSPNVGWLAYVSRVSDYGTESTWPRESN